MDDLARRRCQACEGKENALSASLIDGYRKRIHADWQLTEDKPAKIRRRFEFRNYYLTTAFVNAAVYIAHREDHHPDLTVSYNKCQVEYTTHAIHGLSENDFICAAKVDALFKI